MDEESLSLPPFIGHDEKGQRDYHPRFVATA